MTRDVLEAMIATSMDRTEKFFELLLNEKELVDSQIGGYTDLNIRVFGLFGAGVVLLGWLYSDKAPAGVVTHPMSSATGIIAVAFAIISCGVIVQGVSTYSIVLGYIQYKNEVLNPAFQECLATSNLPLHAVRAWRTAASRAPTTASTLFLFLLHKLVCIAFLVTAEQCFPPKTWAIVTLTIASSVVAATVVTELVLLRAMARVLLHARPNEDFPRAPQPGEGEGLST
jgi:hypothetical protein